MTYILDFLYKLTLFTQTYLLNSVLLVIGLINIVIIRALYQYKKKKSTDYKISYFMLNNLYISIYVIVFITFILIIRYIRWGYTFDLKKYYTKVVAFITKVPLLMTCNIILILIICMLLWLLFKKFLHKEIIKRHIYIYYTSRYNTTKEHCKKYPGQMPPCKDYSLYVIWTDKLSDYWSREDFQKRLVYESFTLPYDVLFERETHKDIKKIIKMLEFLLKYGPLMLFIFLFTYDCIYNNFQLQLVFYYMPIYFIYNLWQNASHWLKYTDKSLNMIIYDLYYMQDIKIYIGMTTQEHEFIITYLQGGLCDFMHKITVKTMDDLDIWCKKVDALLFFKQNITNSRVYAKIDDTDFYKNYTTGHIISTTDLKYINQDEIKHV